MPYFNAESLAELIRQQLLIRGVNESSANHVASSLIQTSLRGVDSHGINLFPHYCRAVEAGRINRNPRIKVLNTAVSTAVVDADHAFGHHAGAVAMDTAIGIAKDSGIGVAAVRNSTHFGAAAYFGLMATQRGCIGLAFTNADALVKASGSTESFFGTNPICFTAPLENEEPFCLDMATSLVTWNKILNFRRDGKEIPVDWACAPDGTAVIDPNLAVTLCPAGSYKGFGLGMMVDILCSVLTGGIISKDLKPMYKLPLDNSKRSISHFFMALDIERFSNIDIFRSSLQRMVDRIRALPPQYCNENVMVPGDPEKKCYSSRVLSGIPLDELKLGEFIELSTEFSEALVR